MVNQCQTFGRRYSGQQNPNPSPHDVPKIANNQARVKQVQHSVIRNCNEVEITSAM
jgi:hypothetical protein